jgi:hypothetical protein
MRIETISIRIPLFALPLVCAGLFETGEFANGKQTIEPKPGLL